MKRKYDLDKRKTAEINDASNSSSGKVNTASASEAIVEVNKSF